MRSPHESLAYIDALGIGAGMLITNTYVVSSKPQPSAPERVALNKQYADILERHPHASHYKILCGVPFQRDDAEEVAAGCLPIPRVRGLKLRNFNIQSAEDSRKFEALVKLANGYGALILAHFAPLPSQGEDPNSKNLEETQKLVTIMDRFPRAILVIAHSGTGSFVGPAQYAWIGDHYRQNPGTVRNIYIETSDSFDSADRGTVREDAETWIRSWKPFGLDRVVYGSDYPSMGPVPEVPGSPLPYLASTNALPPHERASILSETSQRLFDGSPLESEISR
jgi:predicted TIM-barrel fold metal-dependent hydrolase